MRPFDIHRGTKTFLIAGCVAALLAGAGTVAQAAELVLRAGTSTPKGSTAPTMAIEKLAELATQLSNGELKVQVFHQSLGVEQQLIQSVKSGSVDIGEISTSNVSRFTDAFFQFDLPYLFKNDKAYIDTLRTHPAGKKAIEQFEKDLGVKTLLISSQTYDAETSGTDLQTRDRPVKVPADIKGLKLRTGSTPVEIALMKAYGANPTPVDWAQLYPALQQGVVDGTVAVPMPPFAAVKLYEVTKHYMAIGFRHNIMPIYINQRKFDSLNDTQRKALLAAAEQTQALDGAVAREKVKNAIVEVEKAGIKVYHPTKAEMAQWLSVREQVWREVAETFKGKVDLAIAGEIYKLNER